MGLCFETVYRVLGANLRPLPPCALDVCMYVRNIHVPMNDNVIVNRQRVCIELCTIYIAGYRNGDFSLSSHSIESRGKTLQKNKTDPMSYSDVHTINTMARHN